MHVIITRYPGLRPSPVCSSRMSTTIDCINVVSANGVLIDVCCIVVLMSSLSLSLLFTKVKLEEALHGPGIALQTCQDMLQLLQRRYDFIRTRYVDVSACLSLCLCTCCVCYMWVRPFRACVWVSVSCVYNRDDTSIVALLSIVARKQNTKQIYLH